MVQSYISLSISNTLHYSFEIHPYVGEFPYLCDNMIHRFGLYIIAALLSFTLSSVGSSIDEEAISLAVNESVCENLPHRNSDSSFVYNTDAGCDSAISNDTKNNRISTILKNSSNRLRLSVRRISNVHNVVLSNGDNAIHNTWHSPLCLTHNSHFSGFSNPARYLIRLHKFII